jgi:tetratricopeptide (TPR) repeat protein
VIERAENGFRPATRLGYDEGCDRRAAIIVKACRNCWFSKCAFGSLVFLIFSASSHPLDNRAWQETHGAQASTALSQAQTSLAHGNPEEAIRILSEYLGAHAKEVSARLLLGQAYAMTGQTDQAEGEFQAVIKESPNNYVALAALGELYYHANQLERAEPYLARAAKSGHDAPQIRIEWSVVLARLHRYQEAETALDGIPSPGDKAGQISFHRLKASVHLGLGHASAAAAEMEKALALKPDDPGLAIATAAAQLQDKHWKRAAGLAEPIFLRSHDPGSGLLLLEAQLGMQGDFHHTLDLLNNADLPLPAAVECRQRAAELLTTYGQFAEAAEEFQKVGGLDPNRPGLLFNLALAQLKAAQLDKALASAEKSKELGDGAEIEDLLGDIEEARGDNLAAVRNYQAAVTLAPNEEKYRLSLAVEFIRHKNFDAARVVLQQAEKLQPDSWRIQLALGMLEYFTGTDQEATRILVRAASLAAEPLIPLTYLGDIEMNQASAPDPDALARLCQYADQQPRSGKMYFYCGALTFRRDYTSGDKTHSEEIIKLLRRASRDLPEDPSPRCQLGRVYRWLDRWQEALRESESCVRMDPDSAEAHYRLAQIYQHLGQQQRSKEEMKVYESAAKRVADENARRDETIRTFLYTIQKAAPDHN